MGLQNIQIFKLAKTLTNYLESERGYFSLKKIQNTIAKDHILNVLMERASLSSDKVKVIYTTWFLLNRPTIKPEQIMQIISNLYVITIDWYDDTTTIQTECRNCYGDGFEDCSECDGNGKVDCKTCDGEGNIECNECWGEGTEECRNCDGKGTETEEDDEGDEVEVECSTCDGSGKEDCRHCGGDGEYECPDCDGGGRSTCDECSGNGQQYCEWCGGSGEEEAEELYYNVTRQKMIVISSRASKYEDEIIDLNKFNEIEDGDKAFQLNLIYTTYIFVDNVDEDERRESVGMEDNFVEIVSFSKLEDARL
jgi:hypothetical protein